MIYHKKLNPTVFFFADDAKLFKELKQLKDFEEIQDDLYHYMNYVFGPQNGCSFLTFKV